MNVSSYHIFVHWQYFKFKYIRQKDEERQLDEFYNQHSIVKVVTQKDVAEFNHKIWELRLAWFLNDRYTNLTVAFLVKCFGNTKFYIFYISLKMPRFTECTIKSFRRLEKRRKRNTS